MDQNAEGPTRAVAADFRDEPRRPPAISPALPDRAFDEFYRSELPGLVALARGLCPPGIAEDVAQEAMLVAMRRWPEVGRFDRPELWVRRTCANLAVSQFRRKLIEIRAVARLGPRHQAPVPEPVDEGVWSLVRRLPRRQAQVVALHYVLDLSVADIATTLGCSTGTIKVHLSRARETLRQALGDEAEPIRRAST